MLSNINIYLFWYWALLDRWTDREYIKYNQNETYLKPEFRLNFCGLFRNNKSAGDRKVHFLSWIPEREAREKLEGVMQFTIEYCSIMATGDLTLGCNTCKRNMNNKHGLALLLFQKKHLKMNNKHGLELLLLQSPKLPQLPMTTTEWWKLCRNQKLMISSLLLKVKARGVGVGLKVH